MEVQRELWAVISDLSPDVSGFIGKAAELSEQQKLVCRVWVIAKTLSEVSRSIIFAAGAQKICHLQTDFMDCNSEREVRDFLSEKAAEERPEAILFLSSVFLSSVAPGVAARLRTGITADCSELVWDEERKLLQCRPTFGGRRLATIRTLTMPVIATVRRGVFANARNGRQKSADCMSCSLPGNDIFCERLSVMEESAPLDIRNSDMIFAGGAGLGSRENFKKLYRLAEAAGGAVAASRGAVACGYAGFDRQIGQTGISVRPRLYVAFGISGAVQHVCGMMDSGYVIAVNPDPEAPIHQVSDYSVYEDANTVIPMLLDQLTNRRYSV